MAIHDVSKNDRKYEKSVNRDKNDKVRDSRHSRHHSRDETKKLKRRHRSKSRSIERKRDGDRHRHRDRDDPKRRKYDEKYYKKHNDYVSKSKNNKTDFNAISENKHKSKPKRSELHKVRSRSNSEDSIHNNDSAPSTESDDERLLEDLRQKRSHLIAELANQENDGPDPVSVSTSNSIGSPEEININFEPLVNSEIIESVEEKNPIDVKVEEPVDDCFDMFADNFNDKVRSIQSTTTVTENHRLNDNWDDSEGYYKVRLGEVIDGRYTVFNLTGKGVFSNVVKARDSLNQDEPVAIKLIRNNDMMYRAGLREVDFLHKINQLDRNDKYHCVRLLRSFMHKNHLCLVFECLEMNLREVLKKYGRNVGLNIAAVRSYAQQLLLALRLIERAEVVHADIKPDNVLVNEHKTLLKLSDFGSATAAHDNEAVEYLASRYYRAPEVIIGLPYDCGVDLWAVGVSLYELYTGQIMFPGIDNNDMLRLMMEARGRFPNKLLRRAVFRDKHFDEQFNFLQREVDKTTELPKIRVVRPGQQKALPADMFARSKQVSATDLEDDNKVRQFRDLLDRMLQLDPSKRISVADSLNHPFITDATSKK